MPACPICGGLLAAHPWFATPPAVPQPLTVEPPMPTLGWDYVPDYPETPMPMPGVYRPPAPGADNPAPLADVQHPMPGYPLSGVPGGPQPRYNPFTDGPLPDDPPPGYKCTDNDKIGLLFMVAAGIAGIGVGVLVAWGF